MLYLMVGGRAGATVAVVLAALLVRTGWLDKEQRTS